MLPLTKKRIITEAAIITRRQIQRIRILALCAGFIAAGGLWLYLSGRLQPAGRSAGGLPVPDSAETRRTAPPHSAAATTPTLSDRALAAWLRDFRPAVPPAGASSGSWLCLQTGWIDTDRLGPSDPMSLGQPVEAQRLTPRGMLPAIVQFNGPVGAADRARLERAGLIPRGYLPRNAFLVEGNIDRLDAFRSEPGARWIGCYPPPLKIEPFLQTLPRTWSRHETTPFDPALRLPVTIQTLAPDDVGMVADRVAAAGGRALASAAGRRWGLVRAEIPWQAVESLAAEGAVQWIEVYLAPRLVNNVAVRPDMMNATNVWLTHGLTGANQVIGHADTGLDVGNLSSLHPDLRNRIKTAIALGRPGDWSDPHGHGTHTAGSILGEGVASAGAIKGVAFGARLVHQSVLDAGGGLGGLPADLNDLFPQAYTNGARLHSDSWGSSSYGRYTMDSRHCDKFMWDHPDMLLVFSAGNDGADADANGVVDPDSIGAPATAKSALTIGASESNRPPGSESYSSYTWGSAWPWDYPANPIAGDYLSRPADGIHQGLAGFSSRGPTVDGRIKPDLVAPGVNIVSCRSLLAGAGIGWGVYAANANYVFSGGTSMSAPLAAGAAAVAREFYATRRGLANPSAALVKACLLNGARSLSPGQYGVGVGREIPDAAPNPVEGWGQVDIERALFPPPGEYVAEDDASAPLQTGATNRFVFVVSETNRELSLIAAWSDYPATAGAAVTLVNDLDLRLRAPNGEVYWATPGGGDRTNPVETIVLTPPVTGVYTAEVFGANVPYGPQPCALIVRGAIQVPPVIEHTPLDNTFVTNVPYDVVAGITCLTPFDSNSVAVFWNTVGVTGAFSQVVMTQRVDSLFAAALPPQGFGATAHYYLSAGLAPAATTHPSDAPATLHSFSITVQRALVVSGSPSELLTVTPPYGSNIIADGAAVTATATAYSNTSPTTRIACAGWTGAGSAPASGTNASVGFVITADSTLTWNWVQQYSLSQTSSIAGVLGTQTWWTALAAAGTALAPSSASVTGVVYRFTGWWVDGQRQPDDTSPAVNPAGALTMEAPRVALAAYLPESQDADADTLPDWWEFFYFGSTNAIQNMDDDNDGFTNREEYLDGANPRDSNDRPEAPTIAFAPLADPYPAPAPWPIRATVTDNWQIVSVSVWWNRNGGGWQETALSRDAVSGDYIGRIPAPGTNGDSVAYRLEALDAADLKAVNGPYSFEARYPEARVGALAPGPYLLRDGTATNASLIVSNVGFATLQWALSERLLLDDFEQGSIGWSHNGANDVWHTQRARFSSASNAWHFGGGPGGSYPDLGHASLVSTAFFLTTPAQLVFSHWAAMEYDMDQLDNHYWDGGIVELSTNGGVSFFSITPLGGYPHLITDNPDSPFPPETPCFGSTTGEWAQAVFDLSPWTGVTAQVRFRFGADAYVTDEGWYIDDVAVTSLSGDVDWLTAPASGVVSAGGVSNIPITLSALPLLPADTRSAALLLTNNSPIAPWRTVHPLTLHNKSREILVTVSAHGSVAPAGRVLADSGSSASFLMTADPYCQVVSALTNQAAVAELIGATATNWTWPDVTANGALDVTFDWIRVVWDTPLWWLVAYGLTNAAPEIEAVGDQDGDGLLSWQEYWARTDPTNSASVALHIWRLATLSTNGIRLEWLSFTNVTYRYEVWTARDPAAGFTPTITNLPATPPVNVWNNWALPPEGRQFYRIRVLRQ
ncbi:MAG: S8 family serine peptidase [Verrucomicrobiota bacterium]|nr:S8 family serine peptidase [Verrucomicrobiota bacterium]